MTRFLSLLVLASTVASARDLSAYNSLRWNRGPDDEPSTAVERSDWYEWWYYKVVDPRTDGAYYFVYGIVNPWDTEGERVASNAFVGFGDFQKMNVHDRKFSVRDFSASYDSPDVRIGLDNHATDRALRGRLTDDEGREIVRWNLRMEREWDFNAMGWGMFVKGISNIYWYPAQASARMSGTIEYPDHVISLDQAAAYQDRNWGRSMPDWWTWIVANRFEGSPGTALTAGGGRPFAFERYSVKDGMAIGFKHDGKTYEFRTPDGDRISTDVSYGRWEVLAKSRWGLARLKITASAPRDKFMLLKFTSPQGQVFNDYEALRGDVRVELQTRPHWFARWNAPLVFHSREAGIEYGSFEDHGLDDLFAGRRRLVESP